MTVSGKRVPSAWRKSEGSDGKVSSQRKVLGAADIKYLRQN